MTTTNQVPSNDPTDLLFNAQKLDQVVNGSAQFYTDRLGVNRRTIAGIDAAADVVLSGLGYAPPVAYAAGIALTLTTQTVEYAGEVYAPKVSVLPFTTTGTFEAAKFRLIQGVSFSDLSASGGSALIGYFDTDVESHLSDIDANKNGYRVISVDMEPYNGDLSSALDDAEDGTFLLLGMRDYNIVGKHHSTAFTGPYVGNEVKNLKIIGAGMPQVTADGSRFISGSGTVIQGTLINYADGFEAFNLGVDVGSYVNATYNFGGHYPEGFVPGTHKFQGTPDDLTTYIKDVAFSNIKVLAVNNSNHAILCEFINGLSHGYCEAIGGFHGYVCKSSNVRGGNVWAYGQSGDAYIIKSDQYTRAQNIVINSITMGKQGLAERTGPGLIQSTTGGHITSKVQIGILQGYKCQTLFKRTGDNEFITDITIGEIIGDDIVGDGIDIIGKFRRVHLGNHVISNTTGKGILVTGSVESVELGDGVITNALESSYYLDSSEITHGNLKSINSAQWGIERIGETAIDWNRISGSLNALGLASSLYEVLAQPNLQNSWGNAGAWPFQVVLVGSTLHFRGTVRDGAADVIATLPVAYRPAYGLSFVTVAVTSGGARAFAHIDVLANGNIQVANFAGSAPGLGGAGCIVALNFSYIL